VYEVNLSDEARDTAGHLPHDALAALAELLDLLSLQPHAGRLYRGPGSDLRTITTANGQLLAVWLVLEEPPRVEILRLIWLGRPTD
jgi:hypothetical protein